SHVFGSNGFALPMIENIRRITFTLRQTWWRQAIEIAVFIVTDQKKIWEIKTVSIGLRVERRTDRGVDVHLDLVQADALVVEGFHGFRHRKFRGELDQPMLSSANALEDEC